MTKRKNVKSMQSFREMTEQSLNEHHARVPRWMVSRWGSWELIHQTRPLLFWSFITVHYIKPKGYFVNRSQQDRTSHALQNNVTNIINKRRKLCCRKDDRTMRLIYECPESFWDSLTMPMDIFPKLFWCAFVLIDSMNVHRKFEMCTLAVPEIIAIRVLVGGCEP